MESTSQEKTQLKETLSQLMGTLKRNKENVPLAVLKTRYRKGYQKLYGDLTQTAIAYAKLLAIPDTQIHPDYLEECAARINRLIKDSGICKQLSHDIFHTQDIAAFEHHCKILEKKVSAEIETFYMEHLALYVTMECLQNPAILPEIYCVANDCILSGSVWIPLERYKEQKRLARSA